MDAKTAAALAVVIFLVAPISYHLAAAVQTASRITASFGFTVERSKHLNTLLVNAQPAPVKTRILRGAEAARIAEKASVDKPLAVQEFVLPNGKKVYAVILANGRLRLVDNSGSEVKYKLQRLRSIAKTLVMSREGENPGLADIGSELLEHTYIPLRTYRELTAVKAYKAASYRLEALVDGHYVLLGYYINPSAYYAFYLGGRLVYKVVAKGRFYVNPGYAVVLVADESHYEVNLPFTSCSFHVKTIKTSIAVSLRADGTAALLDCPVTTKLHGWALVTVDKYGGIDTVGDGNKWVAFSCGCNGWSP